MNRASRSATAQELPVITLSLRTEADVVLVRQRARLITELLGYSPVDQTRIATAVSEIARNAVQHGGGGRIRYAVSGDLPRRLRITVEDSGSALSELQRSGAGGGRGGGVGLELSRRLMDSFEFLPREGGGTLVEMVKALPPQRQATGAAEVRALVDELLRRPPESLIEELHQQQQELLALLESLTAQQESLRQMNAELEETNRGVMALYSQVTQELDDTNRGVMALYAQLDDQTRELQRVSSLKDRFISQLSHEFRTPLTSTLALSRLLLDRVDGPLGVEQERQVRFIHDGAGELLAMASDLLDLAKIQAGRLDLNVESFAIDDLFSALRGMFRPLAAEKGLELTFLQEPAVAALQTDQQKVAQILRNFVSNALKFTETGEIRISARAADADTVIFEVGDTGIGIPADQLGRIFDEFAQVAGPHQRATMGTGLGLPLSVKLAGLLGGTVEAESTTGTGSAFRLRIPRDLPVSAAMVEAGPPPLPPLVPRLVERGEGASRQTPRRKERSQPDGSGPVVLVIDDDPASRYLIAHTLAPSGCTVVHATTGRDGLQQARRLRPSAIFLDLGLPDMPGMQVLQELKADAEIGDRPIIIYTSRYLPEQEKQLLTGFALRIVTKDDPALGRELGSLGAALVRATERRLSAKDE